MTFYNIIFGIAFIAAMRQFFMAFAARDATGICLAAVVALLVFNDTVYTSNLIEDHPVEKTLYSLGMKLIDLTNFVLLLLALTFLTPKDSFFGSGANISWMDKWPLHTLFWATLSAYWMLIIVWQRLAQNAGPGTDLRVTLPTKALPVAFFIAALMGLFHHATIDKWVAVIIVVVVLLYLVFIKVVPSIARPARRHGRAAPLGR